jgi:hypothetical protein
MSHHTGQWDPTLLSPRQGYRRSDALREVFGAWRLRETI